MTAYCLACSSTPSGRPLFRFGTVTLGIVSSLRLLGPQRLGGGGCWISVVAWLFSTLKTLSEYCEHSWLCGYRARVASLCDWDFLSDSARLSRAFSFLERAARSSTLNSSFAGQPKPPDTRGAHQGASAFEIVTRMTASRPCSPSLIAVCRIFLLRSRQRGGH